jgi:glucan phosphoethanolaminetransferase (alkaline phosphatase superfamily)
LYNLDIIQQVAEEDGGWIEPRPITEQAISVNRNTEADKLIVHYMQPHRPYVGEDIPQEIQGTDVTGKLINNELSKHQVWDAYLDTLRYVLDEVELLLDNIDADTVAITADHGEGFGEHGSYGHDFGWPHPVEKKVPWVETTAFDKGEYIVDSEYDSNEKQSASVEERLRNLGYIED